MSYRALVLPADVTQLTLPMARKLRALVAARRDADRAAAGRTRRA